MTRKKRKSSSKQVASKKKYNVSQVKEDRKQRRRYARGDRIEAYTFGEALGG